MKKLLICLLALALECLPLAGFAQSNPGFTYGQIPSVSQWNAYFSQKLDLNPNGLPIMYGGTGAITSTGALNNLAGSVTTGSYLRGNGTAVVMSPIQAADVPTLNQNTAGTAGGISGGVLGSIPYQSTVSTSVFLAGNTSTVPSFLTSTGTGSAAQAPTLTTSIGSGRVLLTPSTIGSGNAVLASGSTGSGSVVYAISPLLTTPTIGVAAATSVNKVFITTPATSATLTISNGKTLAASNSLTLAGTDGTTLTGPGTSDTLAGLNTSQTFTGTQTFSGTVTGAALSAYLASPPAIGGTAAAAGSFTTLSASSTVSGTGFSSYLASPPAIGGTVAAAGSFTTLSASSTLSGTGFTNYFASPPAIGGTAPSTIKATTATATTAYNLTNLLVSATAPTVGCGSVTSVNGTAAFRVTLSGPANTCTITMPAAATGWNCFAQNLTSIANAWQLKQASSTATTAVLNNYNAGALQAMNGSDVLAVSCFAY